MKKLILLPLLFFVISSTFCQDFEGEVTWKIDAQMLKSKGNSSPENNNAEMKKAREQLQQQLKSPDVANNPQAKEMLEKILAQMPSEEASEGGSMIDNMMPKAMYIKIKNGSTLLTMKGGMATNMIGDILTLKGKPESYSIKRDKKTYTVIPQSKAKKEESTLTVTKTTETMKILGYNCTKYIISNTKSKTAESQIVFATTQIKDIDFKSFTNLKVGNSDKYSSAMKQIEGVPLRMEIKTTDMNMNMECSQIEKKKMNDADFMIPSDYKEVKGMGF